MKKYISVLLFVFSTAMALSAEAGVKPQACSKCQPCNLDWRHEISLGVGDQLFESLVWQNPPYIVNNMPQEWRGVYKERYRYTQHWSLNYYYNHNSWFSCGIQADISACLWDDVKRNGLGQELNRNKNSNFWNLTLMPCLRFWWFRYEYVGMYTNLGFGLCLNGGSETDYKGRHTAAAMAFDLGLVGLQCNYKRYFAFAQLGGLYAFRNKNTIYMLNSRIVSAGIGIKF